MSFLVVAAHPDDEVLGCGASIARWVKEGERGHVLILGEGVTSRHLDDKEVEEAKAALYKDASKAMNVLGLPKPEILKFPDNAFDSVPLLDIVKAIEERINALKPRKVITHFGGDLNIDHVLTHRAVMTATRPLWENSVEELWAFEVNSATDWSFGQFQRTFRPNIFLDVSDTIKTKIDAMNCYRGEKRPWPHPRSDKALQVTAEKWGSVVGKDAVEAFELIKKIG